MRERSEEFGLRFSSLPPYQVKSSRWINYEEMNKLEVMAELLEIYYNSAGSGRPGDT
jgi:hypothetical protein